MAVIDNHEKYKKIIKQVLKNPEQLTNFIEKLLVDVEVDKLSHDVLIKKYNKRN